SAVELVGARPRYYCYPDTTTPSNVRRGVSIDPHLLDYFRGGLKVISYTPIAAVAAVEAVDRITLAPFRCSVYGGSRYANTIVRIVLVSHHGGHPCKRPDIRDNASVAPQVQIRQLGNLLRHSGGACRGRSGVDRPRSRRHFDGLGGCANVQRKVER